jgi:hypothetical protein
VTFYEDDMPPFLIRLSYTRTYICKGRKEGRARLRELKEDGRRGTEGGPWGILK